MILQEFSIGDWRFCVYYDVRTERDLDDVFFMLREAGVSGVKAREAVRVLAGFNKGYTHTDFWRRMTMMFMSKATSAEQMYDSIQHETRHAADNVGEFLGFEARGEDSAYLQGEIARNMCPGAAMVICPCCGGGADRVNRVYRSYRFNRGYED